MSIFDPQFISRLVAIVVSIIVLALAFAVIRAIWKNDINLNHLLSESPQAGAPPDEVPKASLSRFQMLVFTFVVAGLYLVLSLETGTLIDIPEGTLALIGISSGTYVLGKVISGQKPTPPAAPAQPQPPAGPEKPPTTRATG
ncbi:hypothetical protein J2X76_001772 [Neorhizobium sp. 2083]|uniref:hypothetical protein n=1 Tax=Neorhizobium sp. 2083 TaxID=2817762 RepID=UPI0028555236|nr:hypothetical protein [Neorhizobium sp. 2083]MDR6816599.1 hypothetical protein [Neorhizobium sp. 2083]